jgi:hypothetical protein
LLPVEKPNNGFFYNSTKRGRKAELRLVGRAADLAIIVQQQDPARQLYATQTAWAKAKTPSCLSIRPI